MTREGVRPVLVAVVALVVGAVSWMGWRTYADRGSLLPRPSLLAILVLVLMAALVLWFGWTVRRYQRGAGQRTLSGLRAARTLLLAQAGALTGSALTGWYAAQWLVIVPDADLTAYRSQFWLLVALVVLSLALTGAGLLAQSWCRVDPGRREQEDPPATTAA